MSLLERPLQFNKKETVQSLVNIEGYELISDDEENELPPVQSITQDTQVEQRRPRSSTSDSLDDE